MAIHPPFIPAEEHDGRPAPFRMSDVARERAVFVAMLNEPEPAECPACGGRAHELELHRLGLRLTGALLFELERFALWLARVVHPSSIQAAAGRHPANPPRSIP